MINLTTTNEWQHRDETGLVLPWYTKSFLDELLTWELTDKEVYEFGAGASTLWWAKKTNRVRGVESNIEYVTAVNAELSKFAGIPSFINYDTEAVAYANSIRYWKEEFDIIIIDGEPVEWRDACVRPALDCLKPGGRLIIDNWMQPSVGWMPIEETQQLLSQYPVKVYREERHEDWQTAVFTKP